MERRQGKTVGTLVAYRVSDGAEQPFPHYEWPSIGQAIWTRDGKAMVVIAGDGHNQQLWSISPVEVSRRRVTSDMLDYRVASMTDDGSQLVTVAAESTSSVWMAPIDGIGDAIRVSQGRYDGIDGIAAAPDHRVIYRSLESGSPNLWTMAEDGTGKSQVTTDGGSAWPMPIGDRTSMVYSRESDGLWLVGLDGQRPTKLSVPSDASNAVGTPDGKWIFFNTALSGTVELWKVATDGSVAPARVIDGLAARPAISPDGRQIAFYYRDPHATSTGLAVMPIDGPKPSRLYPVAPSSAWSTVRWTADGQGLLHNTAPKDRANIWLQPLAGGPLKQVTHFADQNIMSFDVSTDGKRLVIARGVLSRDAVLMKGFR
jgi:Tol biopolymer transport system component